MTKLSKRMSGYSDGDDRIVADLKSLVDDCEKLSLNKHGDLNNMSFEVKRDSYRAFIGLFSVMMLLSSILNLVSSVVILVKPPANAFATTVDGFVYKINTHGDKKTALLNFDNQVPANKQ